MNVEPVTLEGVRLRMEPLGHTHARDLAEIATPDLFEYSFIQPAALTPEAFIEYIDRSLETPARLPFAMVLTDSGKAIGTSSYHDIRPAHRGLAIGYTWIGRAYQGTFVNPESKYLLLRHAFENLGAIRVHLQADNRNIHSQNAIAKLGAVKEGVLRKHILLPDGYARDTAMFSIIDDEWPIVKANLEERLGYVPWTAA